MIAFNEFHFYNQWHTVVEDFVLLVPLSSIFEIFWERALHDYFFESWPCHWHFVICILDGLDEYKRTVFVDKRKLSANVGFLYVSISTRIYIGRISGIWTFLLAQCNQWEETIRLPLSATTMSIYLFHNEFELIWTWIQIARSTADPSARAHENMIRRKITLEQSLKN